jgi:hypothetical protein
MMWAFTHAQKNGPDFPAAHAVHSRPCHRHQSLLRATGCLDLSFFVYLREPSARARQRIAAAALRFLPYGKFETRLKTHDRKLWCGPNGSVRNAAHYRKHARRFSDARPEAKTSLRGGLASMDGHYSTAVDYRASAPGTGFAPAG